MQGRVIGLRAHLRYTGGVPECLGRGRRSTMVDALIPRSLLLRILDALAEWQMRQSLRAICRGKRCEA